MESEKRISGGVRTDWPSPVAWIRLKVPNGPSKLALPVPLATVVIAPPFCESPILTVSAKTGQLHKAVDARSKSTNRTCRISITSDDGWNHLSRPLSMSDFFTLSCLHNPNVVLGQHMSFLPLIHLGPNAFGIFHDETTFTVVIDEIRDVPTDLFAANIELEGHVD